MKKYTVCAACVYETCFEVEAENETAAEEIILERYNNNKESVPKDEESYVFFNAAETQPEYPKCQYNYIADITFHAGSDSDEDTDRKAYIISTQKPYTSDELAAVLKNINNALLDDDEDSPFTNHCPVSYAKDGINIDTLITAAAYFMKSKIQTAENYCGMIDNFYCIEVYE